MAMAVGTKKRGKRTVIHRNYEYWMHRVNNNGSVMWYCSKHQTKRCKARLVTIGERLISDRQPEHTHEVPAEPQWPSKRAALLSNQTLIALPRQSTLTRVLQYHTIVNIRCQILSMTGESLSVAHIN